MVEILERNDKSLTVRFNNVTGVIPASCLVAPGSPKVATTPQPSAPAQPSSPASGYVNAVNKTKANVAKHDQNETNPIGEILKN